LQLCISCPEIPCNELVSSIEGVEISNCTSGTSGVGHEGDTCIISYQDGVQVTELWECKANMTWIRVSGVYCINKSFLVNIYYNPSTYCIKGRIVQKLHLKYSAIVYHSKL